MDDRVITSKPVPEMWYRGEPYQGMISIAGTLIHPGRGSPASAPPPMGFMSEDDFDLSLKLRGELLE